MVPTSFGGKMRDAQRQTNRNMLRVQVERGYKSGPAAWISPRPSGKQIYVNRGGQFIKVQEPDNPNGCHFVIVCEYGDWSGIRTLDECTKQFNELVSVNRPDGFFWVEER